MMEKNDEISICDEMLPAIKRVDGDASDNDLNRLKSNVASGKLVKTMTATATTTTKAKYDAKMADDDKCINNNQDICKNIKNVNANNKTDCNVVIDDDIQSKQQQQQPQSKSPQLPMPPPSPPPPPPPTSQQTYGCVHYKRKAKFVVSQTKNKNSFSVLNRSFHFLFLSIFHILNHTLRRWYIKLMYSYTQYKNYIRFVRYISYIANSDFNLTNLTLLNFQYSFCWTTVNGIEARAHTPERAA